jgi:hypothetical protein
MNKLFSNFSKKGRETSKGKPKAKKVFVPSLPARPPTEVELLVSKLGTDRAALGEYAASPLCTNPHLTNTHVFFFSDREEGDRQGDG